MRPSFPLLTPLLLLPAAHAGTYHPPQHSPLEALQLAAHLHTGAETCTVWNHHGGDTMYFHPTSCTLLPADSAGAAELEIEGLSFPHAYRTRFAQSDFPDRWRELRAGWWTRVRPDQEVRCGLERGEAGEEWVGCVISPRERKKDLVGEKVEEVVQHMVEAGAEEGEARERVREEL